MKKLILIRHAKSSWKDPNLNDHDRPLNKRGRRDAPFMGKQLTKLGVYPEFVICSTAKRAKQTIKPILQALPFHRNRRTVFTRELYHPPADAIIRYIHGISIQMENIETLALVGHNPGFTSLINILLDDDTHGLDNLPTCGIYCISFNIKKWSKLEPGTGISEFYLFPKGF